VDVGDGVFVVVDFDVLLEFAVFVPVFDLDKVLVAEANQSESET
jgi:hypothetical protein